jgi:hypothetical protein
MPAAKQTNEPTQNDPVQKDVEIVYGEKPYPAADKKIEMRKMPIGKRVPVVLLETPAAHTEWHDVRFRYLMKQAVKFHARDGKKYYEVGESDDVVEARIKEAIDALQGLGLKAKRSIEFTPYLHRREW